MPDNEARAEPLHADTMRVRYLLAVDVSGARYQPGTYEADVTVDEAHALLEAGRVELVGEPLSATDDQHAALPLLEQAKPGDQPEAGISHTADIPADHQL